jgi:hypothetical protein
VPANALNNGRSIHTLHVSDALLRPGLFFVQAPILAPDIGDRHHAMLIAVLVARLGQALHVDKLHRIEYDDTTAREDEMFTDYTTIEAAQALGISPITVRSLIYR